MEKPTNKMAFLAINPYSEQQVVLPTEKNTQGQSWVTFGEGNQYPNFLAHCYENSPTLQAIITLLTDFVCGDSIKCNVIQWNEYVNSNGDTIDDVIRQAAEDILIFGGCALQIVNNRLGQPVQVFNVDWQKLRSNTNNSMFFYSKKFKKAWNSSTYMGQSQIEVLPAFIPTINNPTSIYYFKLNGRYSTYSKPIWAAAARAALAEGKISDFHLNEISNGFASNVIVSLNNGTPTPEVQEDLERLFDEKFCGNENVGRPVIIYSQDKEHSVEIQKIDSDALVDRYNALSEHVRQTLFTAFKINGNLLSVSTQKGFATDDYESTFKLAQKIVVQPIQKAISGIFSRITGVDNAIEFTPYTINFSEGAVNDETVGEEGAEEGAENNNLNNIEENEGNISNIANNDKELQQPER